MFHLLLALGWSTQQPTWQVWFGEGRGTLSSTVRDWPAPVGHLSLSDEGDANAFLCLPEEVSPPNNVDPGEWNVETFVTEALVQFNAAESHGSASGFSAYTCEAQPIDADIKGTGKLQTGPGMEGKWFAESGADAKTWGEKMDFGGKPTVIEVDFPTSTADGMFRVEKLDGIGPARYAEEAQLGDCCAIRVPGE